VDIRFDCVFYYVSDLRRSIRFYSEVLGLRLISQDLVARFGVDGVLLELVPASDESKLLGGGNARLCLSVNDIKGAVSELRAKGVSVDDLQEVQTGLLVDFEDPDGNELVLWQYK
jgi:catechol 2,3-dioxygenase-like lactoylglutathione lyase family enzyme